MNLFSSKSSLSPLWKELLRWVSGTPELFGILKLHRVHSICIACKLEFDNAKADKPEFVNTTSDTPDFLDVLASTPEISIFQNGHTGFFPSIYGKTGTSVCLFVVISGDG